VRLIICVVGKDMGHFVAESNKLSYCSSYNYFDLLISASVFLLNCSICSPPDFGSQGEICLPFEENRLSKVGVRFDKQIQGGNDLGGNCEADHGLFCPVDSLCPDSPGWEVRSKHPFDVIVEFISEEVQHGPLILFLKDTEKICGNNDSYHGLKSKLKHFPAGAFIIGSQIQPDNRKEKANASSLFLSKFPYSQAILDLALQVTFDYTNIPSIQNSWHSGLSMVLIFLIQYNSIKL
jgi:hypothetical protein